MVEDGEPNDPGDLRKRGPKLERRGAVPNWSVGEELMLGEGERLRILAIETEIAEELIEEGFNGVFTVEAA